MKRATFTDRLWQEITPIYDAILAHPLLAELADGSLSRERFVFYMQQDGLYLQDFARTLGLAGVRSPDAATVQAYLDFGSVAVTVERALHESYFAEFGVSEAVEKAPACFAYTNYLLATGAVGSYAEVVAALLPCFWIYREVGNHIYRTAAKGLESNPYRRWIETYAGDSYDAAVESALSITNRVAASVTQEDRERMVTAFRTSSRLEWQFWDSAYRLEAWQPG
jgi:thiaminase (transcriptional activator TenA)